MPDLVPVFGQAIGAALAILLMIAILAPFIQRIK